MGVNMNETDNVEDFLMHFGVKGMKWGQRKNDYSGASRRTNREASKDASEYARAKMFYGEGAGTRRKLIKASVEAKSKKDPAYKAAFQHHLDRQDFGKHGEKARGERKRKNARAATRKTANKVNRAINGPFAGSAAIAVVGAAGAYAHNKGYDAQIFQMGKNFVERRLR